MRRYKRRETLRIGIRDLLGVADLETPTLELSNLADASLQVAYELAQVDITEKYGAPLALKEDIGVMGQRGNVGNTPTPQHPKKVQAKPTLFTPLPSLFAVIAQDNQMLYIGAYTGP